MMIQIKISGSKISSSSEQAFSLLQKSNFGERVASKVEYSPSEALFLYQDKKAQAYAGSNPLSEDQLLSKLKKIDKKIETKYAVYNDLRKKGYILKTALKFGAEFRVYNKGKRPGKDHAEWLLDTIQANNKINWHDFAAKNRVAHSTKKKLLIAIVDEDSSVNYYEVSWKKP